MERGDKVDNTYSLVAISNRIQCWEYPSQPSRDDTSLGGCGYQSSSSKCSESIQKNNRVLVASWIQQELCKSLDSLCWKGNYNREELCCFLAGISLHLVLVCRSLPSIRLTSGGLLSSQIIFNLSFVNIQELASCSLLDVLPQNDVFIHTYFKCAGRFSAHSGSYPKN